MLLDTPAGARVNSQMVRLACEMAGAEGSIKIGTPTVEGAAVDWTQ